MESGLLGIVNSNRTAEEHWTKNCFNSSFPASMACYMLERNIPAIYNHVVVEKGKIKVVSEEIPIDKVFNCANLHSHELYFSFESVFEPYQKYSFDDVDKIDLVVKDCHEKWLMPLEVKLTVLPTSGTCGLTENKWGCELVIRAATTSYCALGMYDSVCDHAREIREIFEKPCSSIQSWDNDFEMTHKTKDLFNAINSFQKKYYKFQKPLLMQTIWKTKGQSPLLSDNAFDIVIWSDYAFSRLFVDGSDEEASTMSRPMRATARLARCLWELSKSGKIRIVDIYRQMAFGNQTDKEFAINGAKWRQYVTTPRVLKPILKKEVISEIIQEGYIQKLRPERRFDQTLYFTVEK